MNPNTIEAIRRKRSQGYTIKQICKEHGVTPQVVARICGTPSGGRPKGLKCDENRERAIEQLRREGYSDDLIRASFGEI